MGTRQEGIADKEGNSLEEKRKYHPNNEHSEVTCVRALQRFETRSRGRTPQIQAKIGPLKLLYQVFGSLADGGANANLTKWYSRALIKALQVRNPALRRSVKWRVRVIGANGVRSDQRRRSTLPESCNRHGRRRWQARLKKNWGGNKTIEQLDGISCRSSGLLRWLTFRSRIALRWQDWRTGWLIKS